MRVVVFLALPALATAGIWCCWSKWGNDATCGGWPGPTGGFCNNDWTKHCENEQECEGPTTTTPAPTSTTTPTPPAGKPVKWVGANIAGFDYGTLAKGSAVWCTDNACDAGGWSDNTIKMDHNCPGYGGDKSDIYYPDGSCGSGNVKPLNYTGPKDYNGGYAAPVDFEAKNFKNNKPSATGSPIPMYSRASPLIDEVKAAVKFGMNTFRVPFRMEYVAQLWNFNWTTEHDEYVPPSPTYLQMVVDYVEQILALTSPSEDAPISVIFDMHNYMRWCPLGIPGTFSCLEPAGGDGSIKYSKDQQMSSCPFTGVLANDSTCPRTLSDASEYWNSPPNLTGFNGVPDYEMDNWTCPLDLFDWPTESRKKTCGQNSMAAPTEDVENPYAKVIGTKCLTRIWHKLLDIQVSSKAFPGQCQPLRRVLASYADESKNCIHIGLMNEPNMVDTAQLASAYKRLIENIRDSGMDNRLLIMGNYWGGLHAQVNPGDRTNTSCGAPSATSQGSTQGDRYPMQIIHETIKDIPNLGNWTYDVHQYFDFLSTGDYDCGHAWDDGKCSNGTQDEVSDFVNWKPFMDYVYEHGLSVAVTEFGGHASKRCSDWLRSFMELMQQARHNGTAGVLMWTTWRTCPHTSWYGPVERPITNADSFANCLQFSMDDTLDPPIYQNLYQLTSADDAQYGLKNVLQNYVYKTAPAVVV